VDLVKEKRSRKGSEKYKARVEILFPHYDLISYWSALGAKVFVGVLAEPFHCWFGFGGVKSTLARKRGIYRGFPLELHIIVVYIQFEKCSDLVGRLLKLLEGVYLPFLQDRGHLRGSWGLIGGLWCCVEAHGASRQILFIPFVEQRVKKR
jgi:hypothetical protein